MSNHWAASDSVSSVGETRPDRRVRVGHRRLGPSSFVPYLIAGLAICFCVQLIYWFQIWAFKPPFLWAYSQNAMVDLLIPGAHWLLQAAIWTAGYLVIAALLWLSLELRRPKTRRVAWGRALIGWVVAQAFLVGAAWVLYMRDILVME